jgi:NAD-dependent SIR2 family protein deacetylase
LLAAQAGHPTIEVNPEPTPLSDRVRWSLRGKAGEIFPLIAAALTSPA